MKRALFASTTLLLLCLSTNKPLGLLTGRDITQQTPQGAIRVEMR
jgi:hypothetical protein